MKAFILAAGIGSRLRPLTNHVPKCMMKVGDETIIEKQIDSLTKAGIKDIYVCTGYKNDVLKKFIKTKNESINFIHNKNYLKTNNMYSMYLTKPYSYNENIIVMNADVFVDETYIKEIVETEFKNCILVEKNRYEEENMKVIYDGNKITKISKDIQQIDAYGTSIDIYKFSREFTIKWFEIMKEILIYRKELNMWNEVAINKMFKYYNVFPLNIGNKWYEIDNHKDLEKAKILFKK